MENYIDCCKRLGKGNFSTVKLVQRKSDQIFLAMKTIDIGTNAEELNEAVQNETLILQRLKHPNIVDFYETFIYDDHLCIIMEYCNEGDLQQRIKEAKNSGTFFSEEQVLDWFTQICLAIQYIYECKIIHRDIKVQNTFLTSSGIIKLGDFGISKQLEKSGDFATTQVGTPYYLTPEMCSNSISSHKSDIWMLGCILYELCSLEKPFYSQSISNVLYKILHEKHSPIPEIYSLPTQNLIDKLLQKDPSERPNIQDILSTPDIIKQLTKLKSKYPHIYANIITLPEKELRPPNQNKNLDLNNIPNNIAQGYDNIMVLDSAEEEKQEVINKDILVLQIKEKVTSPLQSPNAPNQRKMKDIRTIIEEKRMKLSTDKAVSQENKSYHEDSPKKQDISSHRLGEISRKSQKLSIDIPEALENQIKRKEFRNDDTNLQSSLSPGSQKIFPYSSNLITRKKSSFSEQVFDPLSPGSPNRPFFAAQFLKSQLGEEKHEKLKELIEKHENPRKLSNEDSHLVMEIIGENNSSLLKMIDYLVLKNVEPQDNPGKLNLYKHQSFKSPSSATSRFKQSFVQETNSESGKQDTPKNRQSLWNPLNQRSKPQDAPNNQDNDTAL